MTSRYIADLFTSGELGADLIAWAGKIRSLSVMIETAIGNGENVSTDIPRIIVNYAGAIKTVLESAGPDLYDFFNDHGISEAKCFIRTYEQRKARWKKGVQGYEDEAFKMLQEVDSYIVEVEPLKLHTIRHEIQEFLDDNEKFIA